MHLKSLVLKGFKSFADRSILSLEPGITAVVGPNGSGKSNISDAVLWVLGERNARHLRGQAMEDVIFSGSSARKPVSVAEVELVLDNADGTLPVDYSEVSIMRRLYRSGESEYLVNGSAARRMDVLDILHDTGLGTGTHSIISQGSLDSILQSRPEDRRALIEEAAGILKHKQRKEKSARKLEQMDNHLARVRDVYAEIAKRLAPLERKAKRAQEHAEASARLSEVKLALAVDDLRSLQGRWDEIVRQEGLIASLIEDRRAFVVRSEQAVIDLQQLIQRETAGAGEIARSQRRASSAAERLDSVEMLLREKRRSAQSYEADVRIALSSAASKRQEACAELDRSQAALDEVEGLFGEASAKVDSLSAQRDEAVARRRAVERELDELRVVVRKDEREREEMRRRRASMGDVLSNELAREQVIDARRIEIDADINAAQGDFEQKRSHLETLRSDFDRLVERERAANVELSSTLAGRDSARARAHAAQDAVRAVENEIAALEQLQRAGRADDPALSWLVDGTDRFKGALAPLSKSIGAPQGLELLVESLLGEDLAGLVAPDSDHVREAVEALLEEGRAGSVSLMSRTVSGASASCQAELGRPLVELLSYDESSAGVVESLLGDVMVVDTASEAFEAQRRGGGQGARFASRDGVVAWPTGKVRVYGASRKEAEGVLARERRLDQLAERLSAALDAKKTCEEEALSAESACRAAQERSLDLSQKLARCRGEVDSAAAGSDRAQRKLSAFQRERDEIAGQLDRARQKVGDLRPAVEKVDARLCDIEGNLAAARGRIDELEERITPLRRDAGRLSEECANAKLLLATLTERRTYARRVVEARGRDIARIDEQAEDSAEVLAIKRAAGKRCEPLLEVVSLLGDSLRRRARALEDALASSERASSGLVESAEKARGEAQSARERFDEASARMTQVRVDKGRLEVQIEAAAAAITRDCATSIETAQNLPALEDRAASEDEMFRLERRIKNMGAVNPDAAVEFAQLKKRTDFLETQLADMEAARRSLDSIVRIIETRMKDDFVRTFNEVNSSFSEIFSVLFPGGRARLELADPTDIEGAGIEVVAQPRGKRIAKMMLMSGGEKSLTALALLFAVYRIRSTPFYILDEVEAALDDSNLRRLAAYVDSLRNETQLIMITHQRRTMEMADVLFGVSMQGDGVTRVISQKLEHALKHAE